MKAGQLHYGAAGLLYTGRGLRWVLLAQVLVPKPHQLAKQMQ